MIHNRIHENPPTVPILSKVSKSIVPSHFLKTCLNVILPMTPRPSKCSPSLRSPYQNPVCTSPLPHVCYIPLQPHFSSFDHQNNIWWGSTDHYAPRYVVFSTLLSLLSSYTQVPPYSQTLSVYAFH